MLNHDQMLDGFPWLGDPFSFGAIGGEACAETDRDRGTRSLLLTIHWKAPKGVSLKKGRTLGTAFFFSSKSY